MHINSNDNKPFTGRPAEPVSPQGRPQDQNSLPPSPLDIAIWGENDDADWISFPPFFAHVVMLGSGNDVSYGMRMRGAEGRLDLLYGPDPDVENVRRHVELRWLEYLSACQWPVRHDEEDEGANLYRDLTRAQKAICPVPPPGARSPFTPVNLTESDNLDFHRYPVGFPFVVDNSGRRTTYSTGSLVRTTDLKFKNFERVVVCSGPGEKLIAWSLALYGEKFAGAFDSDRQEVMDFHFRHCAERGIKPATDPSDAPSAVVCR
jgi:hypothetical protein